MKGFRWTFPRIVLLSLMLIVVGVSQTWGACTPPPANMLSWWSGNNHPFDLIGLNNGTLTNGLVFTADGKVQQAFNFDGQDDALVMSNTALNGAYNQFTIDAWVFPTNYGNAGSLKTIISKTNTDGFALRMDGNGNLVFYLNTSNGLVLTTFTHATLLPLPLNTWTHVAVVYDGATFNEVALFINGTLVGTVSASGTVLNTLNAATCLMIGNEPNVCDVQTDGDFSWEGRLDEVEFFDRALLMAEIQTIVNAGVDGKCLDLAPDAFAFTDVTGAALSTPFTSNVITVAGLGAHAPISITGGQYSINGGAPTGAMGTVANGNTVTVQQTSAATFSTTTNVLLTIGTVSDTFSVTTANQAPTVTGITPSNGLNNNSALSITNLAGTNFLTGATVKLTRSGQSDINATGVTVVSPTQITCTFNLVGAAAGLWNVVVTNPDAQSATLANGFTIANPAPTLTTITPNNGLNNNSALSITNLAGTRFLPGATVKLTRGGQPEINATGV
ncbi:MAG: LamG domain-containing protein, partial [Deltaproteobacteria bacterium]|nr:LamG domain-containing protein [Deltaproteobacteria bacterium]